MLSELSAPAAVHVVSLVVACAGFLILLAGGVPELQPFPPGVPVLLAVAGAVLAMPARRWVPLIGTGLGATIVVGAFFVYDGTVARLADPAVLDLWSGTVLQIGGVAVAAVAGVVAAFAPRRITATQAQR